MFRLSSPIVLLGLARTFLSVRADGGYGASCFDASIQDNAVLFAQCYTASGNVVEGVLDLDDCFANIGGFIAYVPNGGFSGSCFNVGLSGTVMSATCGNGQGGYGEDYVDLNNWIGNQNGVLDC